MYFSWIVSACELPAETLDQLTPPALTTCEGASGYQEMINRCGGPVSRTAGAYGRWVQGRAGMQECGRAMAGVV